MNARAFLPVLGLLSLFVAACGGGGSGDDGVLAVTAIPQSATLAPGETVTLNLTLTRRAADAAASLRVSGVPTGLMANWEPSELAPTAHTAVLTLRASTELAPGAHVVKVEVTEGKHTASLELPVQVVKPSVSGTIHFQSGRPLVSAIVEVIGHRAVLVDDAGAFEFPEVTLPYDLRVSWPETGSVHIYRGLESRTVALRPFVDQDRPDPLFTDFEVTVTDWDTSASFRPWIFSEAQHASIEWSTLPDNNGRFRGGAIHHEQGPAVLQGVGLLRNADYVVTGYRGFLSTPVMLDEADGATGLSVALTDLDTFVVHPDISLAPGLTLERMCPMVEQPNASMELFCTAPPHGIPELPDLPSGELALLMNAVSPDGALSRNVVRGLTPESNPPVVTFHAPPVLESPASGATMEPEQPFLVAVPGEAPITLTLHRPGSSQEIHVTTREREIAFPDPGPFVLRADTSSWLWRVQALPQATGWEVLEHGGVLQILEAGNSGTNGAPLGPQPPVTRSESRQVSIPWW